MIVENNHKIINNIKIHIIIPSCTDKLLKECLNSINRYKNNIGYRIIIVDSGLTQEYVQQLGLQKYIIVPYPKEKFVFAKAINLALKYIDGQTDVILLNDDTLIEDDYWIDNFYESIQLYPNVGLMFPLLKSAPNEIQNFDENKYKKGVIIGTNMSCSFACVYIKKEIIQKIGLLDESFIDYGGEDQNYIARVSLYYECALNTNIKIIHKIHQTYSKKRY